VWKKEEGYRVDHRGLPFILRFALVYFNVCGFHFSFLFFLFFSSLFFLSLLHGFIDR